MSTRLEVTILCRVLPPYRVALFAELARSQRINVRFAFGQSSSAGVPDAAPPTHFKVIPLHNVWLATRDREVAVVQLGTKAVLRDGVQVIIAEFNPRIISSILILWRARRAGIRFIWWGQGFGAQASGLAVRLRMWLAHRADALLLYGDTEARRFVSLGYPPERCFVARNSVDTEEIRSIVESLGEQPRVRILFVGRLTARKKVNLLIEAFARVRTTLRRAGKLTIVGDGPERQALVAAVQARQLDDAVEFLGAEYEQRKLAPLFATSLAYVCPGCVGLAAVQALACGVPVITGRNEPHGPEIAAVEHQRTGLIVKSDEASAIAQALRELDADPTGWAVMSRAARTALAGYGLATMKAAFEDAVDFVARRSKN